MLRDLAIELLILASLVVCILFFTPPLTYPWFYGLSNAILPLTGFAGLLFCSTLQMKRLANKGKVAHAVAFATFMIATIILFVMIFWIMARPLLL